jgi:acetylornithine deacetylase/succinyl-diaminopimelate desuccinylase-like protein
MLSAHIDTVFPAGTSYQVTRSSGGFGTRIEAPGSSDNSVGVIALLAIAQALSKHEIKHVADIFFIGNVGEEGEGDLRGMRQIFASDFADRIRYTLVLDGTGTDTIVTQALGSRRFEVTITGPGGHSWLDYGRPNPVNALARAISLLQDVPVPTDPRTIVSVGMISGGTSVNTIPECASMRVDLRSTQCEEISKLEASLHRCVEAAIAEQARPTNSKRDGLAFNISVIGDRPAGELARGSHLLTTIRAVDAHLGIRAQTKRSSTDANIPLSLGREAVSIGAGGTGGGAHTLGEWFDAAGRDLALKRILLTTLLLAN